MTMLQKSLRFQKKIVKLSAIAAILLAIQFPGWAQSSPKIEVKAGAGMEGAAASFNSGNYNEAIATWTSLIAKAGQAKDALLNRAKAYLVIRQPLLAVADLEKLEKTAGRNEKSMVLMLKAVAYSDLGNKEEALRFFAEAEAIDQNPYVYINRASVYQSMGNLEAARSDIQKAVFIQPTRANFFNLAVLERRSGNFSICADILTKILNGDTSFAPAYVQRGICLASEGKHHDAIKDLLKAITLEPSIADAYFQMGKSINALGKKDGAKSYFLKSADIYLAQGKMVEYQSAMKLVAALSK
jgi:tetratricopeptide (TPR) repeat protein